MTEIHTESENYSVKINLAAMLSKGVIVSVSNANEAKIAEEAGAFAVEIAQKTRAADADSNRILRMVHPEVIQIIQESITIPVIAKCRKGHFAEAQILESLFVDFIDEHELLTPADEDNYIDKHSFRIPFVNGCEDLGSALRRVAEGAAMLRTSGKFGTGNIAKSVQCLRNVSRGLRYISGMDTTELKAEAMRIRAPFELLEETAAMRSMPVPFFASGGIVTPADAALMIQLGAESIFVDIEIFDTEDPLKQLKAIVGAVNNHYDPEKLTQASLGNVSQFEREKRHGGGAEDMLTTRTSW